MAFLDSMGDDWTGEAQAEPTVETTEAAPETTEVAQEVPEQEPAAEAETAEKPAEPAEEKFNPTLYKEMKEERRKRQEAERELERLRTQVPQPRQAAPVVPDPYEDPQGYDMHVSNQIAQAKWELRAEMSGQRAETMYGKETVEQAIAWAQEQGLKDPTLGQRVQAQNSPVEYVVQQYQQSRTLETIAGRTFEEAAKDYATQQGWIVSPEAQPSAQQQSSSVPPRSLARVPGSGSKTAPSGADWGEVKFPLG
jgi:hypothetical protein